MENDYEVGRQMVAAKLLEASRLAKTLLQSDQRWCCLTSINEALGALGEEGLPVEIFEDED